MIVGGEVCSGSAITIARGAAKEAAAEQFGPC
jgi:hypothetical protein